MTTRASPHGSWADELAARLDALPVPAVLVHLLVWVGLVGLLVGTQWASGASPPGTFRSFQLFGLGLVVTLPWLIGVFNRRAMRAMQAAAPLVIGGPDRSAELEHQLVNAPARITLIAAAGIVVASASRIWLNPSLLDVLEFSPPPSLWLELAFFSPLVALTASAFIVKLVHLTWQIHRVTTRELRVDLWDLHPLTSFSAVTAVMAASFVGLMAVAAFMSPRIYGDALGLSLAFAAMGVAAGVFLLPLLGLHARIVAAKQEAQGLLAREMERAIDDLRRAGVSGDLTRMDPLNKQIGAIEAAQRSVGRVATWPWEPELLRWVVGALLFPILLFVLQYVVGRLLPE